MNLPFDKKYLTICYKIYYLILGALYTLISILSYIQFDLSLDQYDLIIQNWKQSPITEMTITYGECGSLEEQLLTYNWPGTTEGCNCLNISRLLMPLRHLQDYQEYPNKMIYPQSCTKTQLFYGCQTIQPMKKQQFNFFPVPGGEYGYQICVKRERSNSFYENPPQQDGCPEGQLQCGQNTDTIHCTKEFQCPITQFFVNKTSLMTGRERVQMKNQYALFISREFSDGMSPIIEARISEGHGVCMMNHERSITTGREDYLLMSEKKTECEIDKRFVEYYTVNEILYYNVNDQLNLSTNLPGYEISSNYQWGIYTRKQILWKMECRGDMLQDFKDQEDKLKLINDCQIASIVISVIFFVGPSIIFGLIYWFNIYKDSYCLFFFKLGLKIVILIIQLIITIMLFASLAEEVQFLNKVIDKQCSDPESMEDIRAINNKIENPVYKLNLAYLILYLFTTLIDIILIVFLIRKKNKQEQERRKVYKIKKSRIDQENRQAHASEQQGQENEDDKLNGEKIVVLKADDNSVQKT